MVKLLQQFGFGVLMTILSPIFLSIFALSFIFGLFLYLINEPLNIFYFVFGYRRTYQDQYQMELTKRKQAESDLAGNNPRSSTFESRPPQIDLSLLDEDDKEGGDE